MPVETASREPVHGALHLARQEAADAVTEAASEGQGANWAAPPLSSPLAHTRTRTHTHTHTHK